MLRSTLLVLLGSASLALALPTPFPGGSDFTYQGCYGEPSGTRALKKKFSDDAMTVEKCFAFCTPDIGQYAWLEYRR